MHIKGLCFQPVLEFILDTSTCVYSRNLKRVLPNQAVFTEIVLGNMPVIKSKPNRNSYRTRTASPYPSNRRGI